MTQPPAGTPADAPADAVCLGETMAVLRSDGPGGLAGAARFACGVGGAESNVACLLARAGHRVRWVGRLGADGFGDRVLAGLAAHGVDVSAVRRDPHRPTGVYFRTGDGPAGTPAEVLYHRTGSAASAMSPDTVDRATAYSGRVLHLSGITAALSDSCRALLTELTGPRPGRPLLSFDVNHRPALWRGRDPAVPAALARRCDLVFVGADEAREAWGVADPGRLRLLLPEPAVLVVKDSGRDATAYTADGEFRVPAPSVVVTDPVGAGDAFAAGFLSATLRGLPVPLRLRHGHLTAAAVLTAAGDFAEPPARALADRLAALDEEAWARLRLAPGWTAGGGRDSSPGPEPEARRG
ncbi:carbohydrate kinase [Streptomyces carminius]|uniref:Carbohydrate kinase n=1 Tax=Streptomyces carminius TaxID=2665496 RepID=A0A2M8LXG9_9ACTN|nr:sugar kinase [Streptomyces carminius]PJE96640.1 carbohydrate kinase [Streptomyces carminius]